MRSFQKSGDKSMNEKKKICCTFENVKEVAVMSVAVGIIASAVYFFLIPSQTSISSVSALAIILAHYVPLPVSSVTMILNVVLLVIGFLKNLARRQYIPVFYCRFIWQSLRKFFRIFSL